MMANMTVSVSFKISSMVFVLITVKCLPEVTAVNINSNCTLTRCPPGYKFAGCERESGSNDEECQVCEDGTYSQYHSYSSRCQPCSLCSTDEIRVHPCSRTRNTLCRRKTSKFFVRIAEQLPLTQEDEQQGEDSFDEGSGSEVYFDDDEDNVGINNKRSNTSFHGSHNEDSFIVDGNNSTAEGDDSDYGGGGGDHYDNEKWKLKEREQEDGREKNADVQYSDNGLTTRVQNSRTNDSAGDIEVAGASADIPHSNDGFTTRVQNRRTNDSAGDVQVADDSRNEVNLDAFDDATMSRKVSANVLLTIPILIISIIILIIVVLVYRRVKKRTSIPIKRVSEDTCVPGRESCTCTIERRSVGDDRGYSKEPGRRAECNCTAKSIKNQPKENNTVLIGQNDRRIHAIQKNSQIIIPEQYVHDQNTEHIGTARSTSARVITSHVTPDDNFYIKMIAVVGPEGGTISSSETGVSLFIPEMAVPAYKKQNVEIQVSSKLSPFNLTFDDEDSGLPLTPVVHCLSPGRNEFCKRMQLKIPHRAILEENSRFRVRYSHSPLGTKMKWKTLEMPSEKQQNNVVDDFSFTVDEKYFYISTLHFTTFLCESCGKTVNLNLQSVIYGRYELRDGIKQEVYFNVYIFDAILDSEKAIEKNERAHAQRSEHYSLKPNESMNQWCIALLQPPDWKWKLDPRFDDKQDIKMETLHCHFKSDAPVPPFAKFKVVAVTDESNNNLHSHIDAMFTIVQIRKPPYGSNIIEDSKTKQKLSLDFNFADIQQDSKSSKTSRQTATSFAHAVNDPRVVDDITLNKVAEDLDENGWKSTIRHLFVGEGEEGDNVLKNVDHDQRTFKEKKYASLKQWKSIKGSSATYSELQDALKKARATSLASSLQRKVDETSVQEKIEIQIESTI